MRLFAHFDSPEGDRRRAARRILRLGVGAAGDWVTVRDISLTGLLLETSSAMAVGARFELELPRAGAITAVVVWSSGTFYGCEFDQPISQAALSAAVLQSPYAVTGELSPAARDAAAELRRLNSEMDRIAERLDRTIERLRGK
jgi:PilZ domain